MKNIVKTSDISSEPGITVLKFGATWCGPCRIMAPLITKLVEEFPEVNFLSINVDDAKDMIKTYNVKNVPTLIFLKDGQEIQRVVGASLIGPLRKILRDINSNLSE